MPGTLGAGAVGWLGVQSSGGGAEGNISEQVTNSSGSDFVAGEVVRIVADDAVTRSQADVLANERGTVGVTLEAFANGARGRVGTQGKVRVLLDGSAVPAPGDTIWVSPVTAGRATTVQPLLALSIGVIKDTSAYGTDGSVIADISTEHSSAGGGEPFVAEVVENPGGAAIPLGSVVRISGNNQVSTALATSSAGVQGTIGVAAEILAAAGTGSVITNGKALVLMQAGLVGVTAGQTIWVSAVTAGRATNSEPSLSLQVGIIKDASAYGVDSTVIADILVQPAQSAPTGVAELLVNGTTDVVQGEVVRISANSTFVRAQSNAATSAAGVAGVALADIAALATGLVLTNGKVRVLLDAGLSPVAGQTLWVSATTAGRATNLKPANFPVSIGTVKDTSNYVTDQSVVADVTGTGAASGQGTSTFFADWPIASPRYYALDPDGGSANAVGFSDTSMAAAGAVAKSTWAGLRAIIPPYGNARQIVVAVKPRALGATIAEDFDWRGFANYRSTLLEATTDFTDTATDRVLAGAVVASAGPGASGEWTVAGGATAATWAIAAGALPAESTIVGKRVRFTGNVTAALTNVVVEIAIVVAGGGGTITGAFDLAAVPAAGDTFFIEHAGVAFQKVEIADVGSQASEIEALFPTTNGLTLKGFASTSATVTAFSINGPLRRITMGFCEARGTSSAFVGVGATELIMSRTVRSQTGGSVNVGTGLRNEGTLIVSNCQYVQFTESVCTSTTVIPIFDRIGVYTIGAGGGYFACSCYLTMCGWGPASSALVGGSGASSTSNVFGRDPFGTTTSRGARVVAASGAATGLLISQTNGQFSGFSVENVGALPAVMIEGVGVNVRVQAASGTTGNTDVGINAVGCRGSQLWLGEVTSNTISGTAGDIRLSGNAITTHASLAITNIVDNVMNNIQGPGLARVGPCQLVTNKTGSALAVGHVVRSNAVSGEVVSAQADTQANATGVTGVMVTPPANNAIGYRANVGSIAVRFGAGPTTGLLCYLSEATAGIGRDTPPAAAVTNQKLRLGYIESSFGFGGVDYAVVPWSPELVPILSDGVAP